MSQAEQSSGLVCRHFFCVNYQSRKVLANDLNDRLSIQYSLGFVHDVLDVHRDALFGTSPSRPCTTTT